MSKKDRNDPNKPKEFSLSNEELAEMSYIYQSLKMHNDIVGYYQDRVRILRTKICNGRGISVHSYATDWSQVFSTGKFFATKKQETPPVKVNPEEEKRPEAPKPDEKGKDAKSQLPEG